MEPLTYNELTAGYERLQGLHQELLESYNFLYSVYLKPDDEIIDTDWDKQFLYDEND